MKKVAFFLLVTLVLQLVSCGDNSTKDLTLSKTNANLYREGTDIIRVINSNGTVNWTSSNEFVASVSSLGASVGTITANHIGTATIKATEGKATGICNVTVSPQYYLYDEPITEWGVSKQTIKNRLGTPYQETDNSLTYSLDQSKGIVAMYIFENGYLNSVVVGLALTNTTISYYLLERYQAYGKSDDIYFFGNALKMEEASLMVAMSIQSSVLMVVYMPNSTSSNVPKRLLPLRESFPLDMFN